MRITVASHYRLYLCVLASFLPLSTTIHAADPWLSGPSVLSIGERAVMSGGGLPPNQAVLVTITPPDGNTYQQITGVDAEGQLNYEIAITHPGPYGIKIISVNGAILASSSVTVH